MRDVARGQQVQQSIPLGERRDLYKSPSHLDRPMCVATGRERLTVPQCEGKGLVVEYRGQGAPVQNLDHVDAGRHRLPLAAGYHPAPDQIVWVWQTGEPTLTVDASDRF